MPPKSTESMEIHSKMGKPCDKCGGGRSEDLIASCCQCGIDRHVGVTGNKGMGRLVGLIFDERMCKHFTRGADAEYEKPERITAVWDKLKSAGIPQRCSVLKSREAKDKNIRLVHTKGHINLIKYISSKTQRKRNTTASNFDSIYFNEGSSKAAYLAAGSIIEVAEKVAKGELNSAFAIVRPPGHHAEEDKPMGFCLFNNVAIATSSLLNGRPELGIQKILIVDWDVHHGNGTQKMFWKDPRVLVFSVHRHDSGNFYPFGGDGFYNMIGEESGKGYNINVPWENAGCGDSDYLAVWEHILIPVAKVFKPELIVISAGFDAAVDDPLGGCNLTPYGYSTMLNQLMEFADGKIVMALEGGYNLDSLANSVLACVEVLLENKPINGSCEADPLKSTWHVIKMVRQQLSEFWPILAEEMPEMLTRCRAPTAADAVAEVAGGETTTNEAADAAAEVAGGVEGTNEAADAAADAGGCEEANEPFRITKAKEELIPLRYTLMLDSDLVKLDSLRRENEDLRARLATLKKEQE